MSLTRHSGTTPSIDEILLIAHGLDPKGADPLPAGAPDPRIQLPKHNGPNVPKSRDLVEVADAGVST